MRLVIVTDGNLQGTRLYDGEGVDLGSTWARVVGAVKDERGDLRVSIEIDVMDIPLDQIKDEMAHPVPGSVAWLLAETIR